MDDIRVYNRALSSTEVSTLCAGGRTGTAHTFSDAFTASGAFNIIEGTVANGAATQTISGGLLVYPNGALTMSAAGSVALASGTTLYMNGTLNASNTSATIRSVSGNYAFTVGSGSWTRPILNINGLRVQNTDTNGMRINADPAAVTTFRRFDNIAFSAGTGTRLLQIYSPSLYLTSSGCTFDSGVAASTTYNVSLTGNGTTDGETRAIFGGSTCANNVASCQAWKNDDDANNDGVGNTPPTGNEAVVQFVAGAGTDLAGTIEGFPSAAFDWNTFAYYSTYVTFHDASGTADRVYVRTQTGAAEYYWETASGEEIVGTPRWNTSGTTHYLYVATSSGKVYRLIDNGSTLVADNSGSWAGANNPFDCGCTIVTPLTINTTNLWWGGTTSGPTTQKVWTLGQATRAQPMGSPFTITPTITSAAPALWVAGSTSYLMIGLVGNIIKLNVSNQTLDATNTNPGSASVMGRISLAPTRLFAADSGGRVWGIDTNNFAGTNRAWQYTVGGTDQILGSIAYDAIGAIVHFGTEQGKVGAVQNATGTALTGYPFVPGSTSDKFRAAPLYVNGILVVGTTTGKLYFYDRNTGTGPAFIRQYYFGPTQSVSAVGYDSTVQRYMVSTADPTTKDGKLYFFDVITDPTATK
jgi:hypothetical protein